MIARSTLFITGFCAILLKKHMKDPFARQQETGQRQLISPANGTHECMVFCWIYVIICFLFSIVLSVLYYHITLASIIIEEEVLGKAAESSVLSLTFNVFTGNAKRSDSSKIKKKPYLALDCPGSTEQYTWMLCRHKDQFGTWWSSKITMQHQPVFLTNIQGLVH